MCRKCWVEGESCSRAGNVAGRGPLRQRGRVHAGGDPARSPHPLPPEHVPLYYDVMPKHILIGVTALLQCSAVQAAGQAAIDDDGAAAMGVALRRLGTTKRVLMIAAHPDDENTAVIAELALGHGADVAYLSLTRGEGGQNLIGPELQEGLGLIRSEELLAARRLDGARQFFTRAYDFGFSKSAAEAFRQWPKDTLLADVVEVVRRYRPDIIIAVFSGTPADGHGQHQASGILAREAFAAAADPARFPEQLARGLRPHRARYLFQAPYRPPPDATLRLSTGDFDPLFARSRYQIAMQSRSRHRSQDMGRAQPIGPQATSLIVVAGAYPPSGRSLFAGVDTTLSQRARSAGANSQLVGVLTEYESTVLGARAAYNPLRMHELVAPLAKSLARLQSISLPDTSAFDDLRRALRHEIAELTDAVRQAAGVVVDVVADTPHAVPGETFGLGVTVWNGGRSDIRVGEIVPLLPAGWTHSAQQASNGTTAAVNDDVLAPNGVMRRTFRVHVPADASPTEAYYLRSPRAGALYRWDTADTVRTLPFAPAAVRAAVALNIGADIRVERPAEFVAVEKAGEVRQPLLVVPRVSVAVEPRTAVLPQGDAGSRTIVVTVTAAAPIGAPGTLRLQAPSGWRVQPATVPVELTRAGETRTVEFNVTPPADARGVHTLRARFETDGGVYDRGYVLIQYPHIRPQPLYRTAEVHFTTVPVEIAPDLRIGYIEGAGDDGAAALRQLGARVESLDAAALANADLSSFDAIVAGIRVYEVRADLIAHNERLLDYVLAGGTFVVQYNQYPLVEGGFMPFPATMARPHGRVTDENATVTMLAPGHPALSTPNRITAADFDGWVQERGLYYLDSWDERYTPLLEMADPDEPPQRGALVVARAGSGWYVYTGLALFRQLREGVPGAYRLLANLVSLGRSMR
jgi:LmbE family N-acetylglucosaminyl deacetylase